VRRWLLSAPALFALTLFVSAFLLFLIEPMVGKMLLPLYGGAASVWTTCLVFFQAALLAGYAYAHASTAWLGARKQAVVHLVLLLAPAAVLPIAVRGAAPAGAAHPALWLLMTLLLTVGLPFFVVAATAPLLQRWFADTTHPEARDPYSLYAAANLGSVLALVGYPFLIAPHLTLAAQRAVWAVGYGVLAALIAGCALLLWKTPHGTSRDREQAVFDPLPHGRGSSGVPVTAAHRFRWLLLAAVPASLLLGVTAYLTTDVAAHPLLWMPPLTLYLFSFILVFSHLPGRIAGRIRESFSPQMRSSVGWLLDGRRFWALALPLVVLILLYLVLSAAPLGMGWVLTLHLTAFFAVCMVCHGELARDRPAPERLTEYYLWLAAGGALGGVFNAAVAPVAFNAVVEYPIALALACLLLPRLTAETQTAWGRRVEVGLIAALPLVGLLLIGLRLHEGGLEFARLADGRWVWHAAALLAAGAGGAMYVLRRRDGRGERAADLLLPLGLGVLVVGLLWGVGTAPVYELLGRVPHSSPTTLQKILCFGLPALICFTFVDRPLRFGLGVGAFLLAAGFCGLFDATVPYQARNFYGVLQVTTNRESGREYYCLYSGTTLHGQQAADGPDRGEPLAYYHRSGPAGQVFAAYNGDADTPRDVVVIGLGAGALAAYARPGQRVTFCEIDPRTADLCRDGRYFTYWADAQKRGARLRLKSGDARLTLRDEDQSGQEKYGILVVDAFSSDAVPTHLIDREALALYLRRLDDDGIVLFHISNLNIDLEPVLANLARDAGLAGLMRDDPSGGVAGKAASTWAALARKKERLAKLPSEGPTGWREMRPDPAVGVWTDDYSNLLGVLRLGR
jgi:hypothetical protein